MRSPGSVRAAMVLLLLAAAPIALTATIAPRAFYDDFPFLASWVDLLPPYNEHLVTDVGGLYLGFAVLFAWSAWTLEATLVRAVSVAWLLAATLHFAFHAHHLDGFGVADAIGELVALGVVLVAPLVAIWASGRDRPRSSGP